MTDSIPTEHSDADVGVALCAHGLPADRDVGTAPREDSDAGTALRADSDAGMVLSEDGGVGVATREDSDAGTALRADSDAGMVLSEDGGVGVALREDSDVGTAGGGREGASSLSQSEFACHCCYEVLLDPTTLSCGHSFCRHCLALWWESSSRTQCPECRETWDGIPKTNVLLRDAVEKLFEVEVRRRRVEVQSDPHMVRSLQAFKRHADEQSGRTAPTAAPRRTAATFCSGVLTTLTGVAVMLLVYHWSSREVDHEVLVSKPISKWTTDDVTLWMEHLGDWTSPYRDAFNREQVNGRLLVLLSDEDLSRPPYSMEIPSHRRAVLQELQRVQQLGVKPPQNLWEYKVVNGGKALFLLYALKDSPRLTLLYLYLFDYEDTFLPFIHTCCPAHTHSHTEHHQLPNNAPQVEPSWQQWVEFVVKYCLVPYQLLAAFAWEWLSVHYWTSRFIILNTMLLSVLEGCAVWRMCSSGVFRRLPKLMWAHVYRVLSHTLLFMLLWPLMPQFLCNCLFYWALYFNPIINIDTVVRQLLHTHTHHA